jgi:hypothetical protein
LEKTKLIIKSKKMNLEVERFWCWDNFDISEARGRVRVIVQQCIGAFLKAQVHTQVLWEVVEEYPPPP